MVTIATRLRRVDDDERTSPNEGQTLMASPVKILAFAGSLRRDSYNKKLVRVAAAGARGAGAEVTELDLRNLPLPIFDEDLEAADGLPPNARRLKDLMLAHDGFLISAPEYNSSITAVLKNAIDWASRPVVGEPPLACFVGKVASLIAASPGTSAVCAGLVTVRFHPRKHRRHRDAQSDRVAKSP